MKLWPLQEPCASVVCHPRSGWTSSGDRAPVRELRGVGGTLVKKNPAVARRRAGGTLQSKGENQLAPQPASKSFRF